jgi:RNA polymerase primary sigma factor/RNA polymerase sigma factor
MHTDYKSSAILQLRDQQVRFAPIEKRIEQSIRAEKLLNEIDPERTYSYEFICFRVTGFRPEASIIETMSGADAVLDLHKFIEDVTDSAEIHADRVGEPVHTVDELAKMFNVSSKTISRWRQQGLVSRKFIFDGRRKRVGFLRSSVERFVVGNREKVRRGERFSQLTDHDRDEILERARRMARAGGCPSEVTRRIASTMDRSIETIRYTIKRFDQENPDLAIFPTQSSPLNYETKQRMYQEFLSGTSVEQLMKRYCRTRTTVYRIVNEMRAMKVMELPLEFMDSPEFHVRNAEARILAPLPVAEVKTRKTKAPAGLPSYLAALYEHALLTREQEAHLFRKMNYLKFKASKLRSTIDLNNAKTSTIEEVEELYDQVVRTKNQIVQSNLRLVVSIAKRHVGGSDDFFQLVSDGNMSLIRAVEKFDYSRGNKFSTYASWAIMKNFARTIPQEFKQRDRFRTSSDELFGASPDERSNNFLAESAQSLREEQIRKILHKLDEREQQIIVSRFGLDHNREPLTLKEVGEELGVTKERIRQIEARALNKLRVAAAEEKIELVDEQ